MEKERARKPSHDFLDRIDFVLSVYKEKTAGSGEDAFLYSANSRAAVTGVFDGCGGAGAKHYVKLQGKTGAYAASRIAAGAVREWFSELCENVSQPLPGTLKKKINEKMEICYSAVDERSKLVSSMVKDFPTTAAVALCTEEMGRIRADIFWAGDSRVYLLNEEGLAQLTADDLVKQDAMENLYDDGVMTNVISSSRDYTVHHGGLTMERPGILFAATDGCFGYVSTPMEFEYLLLESLTKSHNVSQWERQLCETIGKAAGDDYTLCGLSLGFGGFDRMRSAFLGRKNTLFRSCISGMGGMERKQKTELWNQYAGNYYRLIMSG